MGQETRGRKPSIRQSIRQHWREFAAASAGNALEFYDILIYGYFAITIGHLFFPNKDSAVSLLISVGTFGISFITRPLGSIILGSYADKAGRKASMSLSITLMVVGTALITFCPTYENDRLLGTAHHHHCANAAGLFNWWRIWLLCCLSCRTCWH